MVVYELAKGFQAFKTSVEKLFKENARLYIYFYGEKDEKGVSWCPDCNEAGPIVDEAVKKFACDSDIFLSVDVGNREFWKDMKNPFREDPKLKLQVLPTLIRWDTVYRLYEDQCKKPELLKMLFSEEDE